MRAALNLARIGDGSSRLQMALFVGLVTAGLALAMERAGWLEPIEIRLYDLQLALRGGLDDRTPPIVLVVLQEEDIRRFGHPIRDREMLVLIDRLAAAEPRAIGIDLYRDVPVPRSLGPDPLAATDDYLALGERVRADPRIVMTMRIADASGPGTDPPAFLASGTQVGFSDLPLDRDGRVRRGLLYLWQDGETSFSMALQLAARFLAAEGISPGPADEDPDLLALGPTVVTRFEPDAGPFVGADAGGYQFLLDFDQGARGFTRFRVGDVLDPGFDPATVHDKVVLVGTMAPSVKDNFRTVLDGGDQRTATYGIEIHAHSIDQLIRFGRGESAPLRTQGGAASIALTLLFAIGGAGIGLLNRSVFVQITLAFSAAGMLSIAAWQAFSAGLFVPVVPPLLSEFVAAGLVVAFVATRERADRRAIAGLFSRFQGPAVAEEIWRQRQAFLGEGGRPVSRRLQLTALMSDLEGYTEASESLEPQTLMVWINEYMNAMAQTVEAHGGVVDDYAGDGVKANFGFPVPSESESEIDECARAAVRCALAMGEKMDALNASWRSRGLPTGRCRVGVFTGPAVVGCIGGDRSLKLTSVGDTINTAARLESFAKDDFLSESATASFRILIGPETRRRIGDAFEVVSLGAHPLKGKSEPMPIFRVTSERSTS